MTRNSQHALHRREWLSRAGAGFGSVALASMLGDATRASGAEAPDLNGGLHHRAKVRRVIQLFMTGGVSQMDTYDPKPELDKQHGKQVDLGFAKTVSGIPAGAMMKSPFAFKQYGQCGRWASDVFSATAEHADDMAFLLAMQAETNVHGPASYLQNTGFLLPGFPAMGSWISYGLGRLTQELPDFVVLPDARGLPYNNTGNFSSGFLPAEHSPTIINPSAAEPIANLQPPASAKQITRASENEGLALLEKINRRHAEDHPRDSRLAARIESFELAARMQLSAPEALDLSKETEASRKAYAIDEEKASGFGRNCLIARRLVERGVRFVQVWSGPSGAVNNWDNHTNIEKELPAIAKTIDGPTAALLADLKQRGLMEDTLVVWTTEFGRMPCTQGATGRDHNGGCYVTWLSGAGVRGGVAHGRTDDFGYKAVEGVTTCHDLHATMLHLMGIDHTRLTFRHNGVDRRLTDVHGKVINEVLI